MSDTIFEKKVYLLKKMEELTHKAVQLLWYNRHRVDDDHLRDMNELHKEMITVKKQYMQIATEDEKRLMILN